MKNIVSIVLALCFVSIVHSQEPKADPDVEKFSSFKVEGLELPPDQTVNFDEGFVNIQAKCKGDVKWLVLSGLKVKYVALPGNSIIISVPPQKGVTITVFAVGLVDGNITEFARTNILVSGGLSPPDPIPVPATGYHVTFLVDLSAVTPDLALVLNSQPLRQAITGKGNFFRLYDLKSPLVAQKKFDTIINKVGGNAVVIIQRADGVVIFAQQIPRNEKEAIDLITKALGS